MLRLCTTCVLALSAALASVACEQVKSANALSPDVAGPIPGVAISAPKPLLPSQGAQVVYDGAPQTLLIENAATSGQRALHLQLEMAADVNFAQLVHHAERIEPGPEGRTSYRLPEPLGSGYTYYWRTRAADGANTGPFSFTSTFTVIDPTVIEVPVPIEPVGNLTSVRPMFRVRNGQISGTTGVYYRFELTTAPDFSGNPLALITVTPGSNGETALSMGDLPHDRTFFWRAYGSDGTTHSGFSNIVSFRTPAPPPPPPPPPPTPTPAPAPGGGGPPLPGGGGGRTPDPPAGQRLPLPNMLHVVQQVASARPDLLYNSCQEGGGSWAFMDLVVDTLRTYDTRWGYNGKRGNPGDPSHDVVDYHYGAGPEQGSGQVYIVDILGGHCGPSPSPSWNDVTAFGAGVWISRGRF